MKYEIVSITAGVESVMLETNSLRKAQSTYSKLTDDGALVRVFQSTLPVWGATNGARCGTVL